MSEYAAPLLWSFLPAQLTAALLPTLSGLAPGLLPPSPPGTPGYARNFRRVITALVLGWLAYAFITDRPDEKGGDWYDLLGVPVRVGEDGLKKAFRGLSRKFHPDKVGPNPPPEVEARFVAIRAAYEALSDPVRRFAYDRFGPDIAGWQGTKTVRDYMMAGVQRAAGFYVVTVGLLLALGLLGRAREGAYWRLVLVGALLVAEASLVLAPTPGADAPLTALPILSHLPSYLSTPLARVLPRRLLDRPAYQYIALLRRLTADAGVAISQLADVWADKPVDEQAALKLAVQLNQTALSTLAEEIGPVLEASNDRTGAEKNLIRRIEDVVLDRGLAAHPLVGPTYTAALERELKGRGMPLSSAGCDCGEDHHDNDQEGESSEERPDTSGTRARAQLGHTSADSITPADLVALGKAMPLPPSPPTTPAPESLGQVVAGAKIKADTAKAKAKRQVKELEVKVEEVETPKPLRRSARLSRSPGVERE
ncbi:hypothetical protein CspHIS471_0600570 [Cutaneotrichosporon sp. HIS471]|nr:hypothetical protein CspHIS471_0600570 [Cutaneotrichosporon sp. HIS471]